MQWSLWISECLKFMFMQCVDKLSNVGESLWESSSFEAIDPKISLELIFFTWIIMTIWSLIQSFLSFSILWNMKYCFASFETSLKWDTMNRAHCVLVLHACHFPMCWSSHIYNSLYMNSNCRFLKFQLFSLLLCTSWPLWPLGTWTTIGHY